MKNLDAAINKASFALAEEIEKEKEKKKEKKIEKEIEKEIEKAMGILANDGVYAFVIFCESKGIWVPFKKSINKLDSLFPATLKNFDTSKLESDTYSLSDVLFVKEILEKMLTYTRYHLKAKGD